MNTVNQSPGHPPREEVKRFLVGDLPEEDIEKLGEHLELCPACQRALPVSVPADPLVDALRGSLELEPHAGEPECAGMIETLANRLHTANTHSQAPSTVNAAAGEEIANTPGRAGADRFSPGH